MKRVALFAAFLLAASQPAFAAAARSESRLRGLIAKHEWTEGVTLCERLPETEDRRPDRGEPTAPHYSELAALCAAISSGAGDQDRADWWWFTATAMDLKTALKVLPEMREQGLLVELAPPRSPAHQGPTTSEGGHV